MVVRLTKPGKHKGVTFDEGLLIESDGVILEECSVNGHWADGEPYGVKVAGDSRGVPYRGTNILGCEVSEFYKKGILAGWTRIVDTHIHDIGSDGIFVQPWGRMLVDGCVIERLGYDPMGTGPFKDREDRLIHGDAIQAMGGLWIHVKRTKMFMNQNDPAEPLRVGNACFYGEADGYPLTDVFLFQCLFRGANHLVRIRDEPSGKPVWEDETHATGVRIQGCVFEDPWSAATIFETEEPPFLKRNDMSKASPRKRR